MAVGARWTRVPSYAAVELTARAGVGEGRTPVTQFLIHVWGEMAHMASQARTYGQIDMTSMANLASLT